ncbi:MAG: TolC family protein [Deferribacteraceae bacterium]|jgi:outer membrane protein TolC|nr:TolC family protein [Deferribacteraceae bacterium]
MRIIFFLSFFLFTFQAFGLNLTETINLSIENSDKIKQAKAAVETADYTRLSSRAAFMPSADLAYGYNRAELVNQPNQLTGVEKDITSEEANLTLTLGINLFNGFTDVYNYRLSDANLSVQKLNYRSSRQDIILSAKSAYIAYLKARDQYAVAEQSLKLLEAQKRSAEISYEVGSLSKSDVLRVDVQLASTQLQLLNAKIAVRLARQQLEYLIGREIGDDEKVERIAIKNRYPVPKLDDLYDMLESNRSELDAAKLNYEGASLAKNAAKGSFYPKLSAGYSIGLFGDDINPAGGRDSSYDSSRVLSVSASWNLFKGLYDHNTYLANTKREQAAALVLSDLRKSLRLAVYNAYESYFSAMERLKVARVGVTQAQESYRVMQNMFENSEATTTDLLDANIALDSALISRTAAIYDVIAAIAQIERAVEIDILGLDIKSD